MAPRGPSFGSKESKHLGMAWMGASRNSIHGAQQKGEAFYQDLFERFCGYAPKNHVKGTYGDRSVDKVTKQWRDVISKELLKFSSSLRLVVDSRPTGVNESQILSMAVAIHEGRVDERDYRFSDHPQHNWKLLRVWLAVCNEPKFQCRRGSSTLPGGNVVALSAAALPAQDDSSVTHPSSGESVARGPGRNKAKQNLLLASSLKKKAEIGLYNDDVRTQRHAEICSELASMRQDKLKVIKKLTASKFETAKAIRLSATFTMFHNDTSEFGKQALDLARRQMYKLMQDAEEHEKREEKERKRTSLKSSDSSTKNGEDDDDSDVQIVFPLSTQPKAEESDDDDVAPFFPLAQTMDDGVNEEEDDRKKEVELHGVDFLLAAPSPPTTPSTPRKQSPVPAAARAPSLPPFPVRRLSLAPALNKVTCLANEKKPPAEEEKRPHQRGSSTMVR